MVGASRRRRCAVPPSPRGRTLGDKWWVSLAGAGPFPWEGRNADCRVSNAARRSKRQAEGKRKASATAQQQDEKCRPLARWHPKECILLHRHMRGWWPPPRPEHGPTRDLLSFTCFVHVARPSRSRQPPQASIVHRSVRRHDKHQEIGVVAARKVHVGTRDAFIVHYTGTLASGRCLLLMLHGLSTYM